MAADHSACCSLAFSLQRVGGKKDIWGVFVFSIQRGSRCYICTSVTVSACRWSDARSRSSEHRRPDGAVRLACSPPAGLKVGARLCVSGQGQKKEKGNKNYHIFRQSRRMTLTQITTWGHLTEGWMSNRGVELICRGGIKQEAPKTGRNSPPFLSSSYGG